MDGIITIRVSMIILRNFAFCINLKILATLKALMRVVLLPTTLPKEMSSIIPTIVAKTIKMSNLFQLSLKYLKPKALIFNIASIVKTKANM